MSLFLFKMTIRPINTRLGNCGFIRMFSAMLEKIRLVITNIYNNSIIPIKLSALKDDEVHMQYYFSKIALYQILHWNALEMNWLLPIKWSNDVMKKLWWVNGNIVNKLKTLLLEDTCNTSLSSVGQSTFHVISINRLNTFLNCSTTMTPNFCQGKFYIG